MPTSVTLDTAGDFLLRSFTDGTLAIYCAVCGRQVGGGMSQQVRQMWAAMTGDKLPRHDDICEAEVTRR